jgi:hypothetical protein
MKKIRAAYYHSMQNLKSSSLLSTNVKIKTYITLIFPVVLCGCGTWLLTLKEELRLRVFKNRVMRKLFAPQKDKATGK